MLWHQALSEIMSHFYENIKQVWINVKKANSQLVGTGKTWWGHSMPHKHCYLQSLLLQVEIAGLWNVPFHRQPTWKYRRLKWATDKTSFKKAKEKSTMTRNKVIRLVFKMTLFVFRHKDGQMVRISWINNFYSVQTFPNKRLIVSLQQSKLIKCLWND